MKKKTIKQSNVNGLLGEESCCSEVKTSWQSLSFGITNVTHKNVLERISKGEPVVVNDNFSILDMCE